jgi:hypothetical protein
LLARSSSFTLVVTTWVSSSLVRAAISYRLGVGDSGGARAGGCGPAAVSLRWAASESGSRAVTPPGQCVTLYFQVFKFADLLYTFGTYI